MAANVESMFYVREKPWHGLGTMVTEAPASIDALVYADLDWTVLQKDVYTEDGGHNRLVIKDGKAWVEEASCPDGICAAHKPIHREGESIVCLPNKVVVTVVTAEGGDNPDVDVVL